MEERTNNHNKDALVTAAENKRAQRFWHWLETRGRRPRTIQAYHSDWRIFAEWYQQTNGEAFDLTRLTVLDLNDYRKWALSEDYAPNTINRRLGFLKHYAKWGLEQGEIEASVFQGLSEVQLARKQDLAPRSLSQQDVRALLKELELRADARDQAIVYTLLYTGLRVGELANLEIEDLELSERKGTIVVRGENAKGGKQRHVPVPLEARKRLQVYISNHRDGSGALLRGQRGPLGEDAIARIVKKYADFAQLDDVTPHVLRHTFAYAYLSKTQNDLVGLANILGHENLATTQIYTQKSLGTLQEEVEKLHFF